MFSSALKSFSSGIQSAYTLSPNAVSTSGPWRIFDGKKKSTSQIYSVFVFERKSLENSSSSSLRRSAAQDLRKIQDESVERLKTSVKMLAQLRHPSILELVEPLEESRSGTLMFVTEHVQSSLGRLLNEKTEAEESGRRYVLEDSEDGGGKRRREIELDELEIQKGLLQVAKGLQFLHESAKRIHGGLDPEAIFINAKVSTWSCPQSWSNGI